MRLICAIVLLAICGCSEPKLSGDSDEATTSNHPSDTALPTANQTVDHSEAKNVAVVLVREMNQATLDGNYSRIAELTHPALVKAVGGQAAMIAMIERGNDKLTAVGIKIRGAAIGDPGRIVASGSEWFLVVPFVLEMKVPNGKLFGRTFVIGVSIDRGATWRFLNGDVEPQALKQLLPNLPEQLRLPAREKPIVYPE